MLGILTNAKSSSNLQSYDCECCQDYRGDPEAHCDFRFVELSLGPPLEDETACGVKVFVEFAEIVVDGGGTEYSYALPFSQAIFEIGGLQYHTEAFHKEYATKDGQHQFLVHNDGANAYHAAYH